MHFDPRPEMENEDRAGRDLSAIAKTIVAKEDRHFYSHPGVDLLAVTRAFFTNIFRMRRTSGASTITMQVAKALEPGKRNME